MRDKTRESSRGFVFVMFAMLIIIIMVVAALAVDVGLAFIHQKKIQTAADLSAVSAVYLIGMVPVDDTIIDREVRAFATENGLTPAEVAALDIQCGRWDTATETFNACRSPCNGSCVCPDCSDVDVNSVRVSTERIVPTSFGRLLNINMLRPDATATSVRPTGVNGRCMQPFGVLATLVSTIDPNCDTNQNPGCNTFTITDANPDGGDAGNWGKLDVGGNMSSGTNFEDAMLNGVCDSQVQQGAFIEAGTGFGGSIRNVFNELISQNRTTNLIFALTSPFPNGNHPVEVLDFIKVDFLSQQGSGNGWQATFRVVENPTDPSGGASNGPGQVVLAQ